MKKILVLAMTVLMAVLLTACGNSTKAETKNENASPAPTQLPKAEAAQAPAKTKKVLVTYFSRSGNTREMAEQIQKSHGRRYF